MPIGAAVLAVIALIATRTPTAPATPAPPITVVVTQPPGALPAQAPVGGSTAIPQITDTPFVVTVTPSSAADTPVPPAPHNQATVQRIELGRSVDNRSIEMMVAGYTDGPAVVVIGSIEGDQGDTRQSVDQLINWYGSRPEQVPNNGRLYLIRSLNPDGNARSQRLNSHNVDLNRNWSAANWVKNATCPGCGSGAGGSAPFSEPETSALRDLLLNLQNSGWPVRLVLLHSTQQSGSRDQVFPGYTATGIHPASDDLTRRVGNVLGYRYNTAWTYDTTGEVIGWCAEQSIPSVDIVSYKNSGPSQDQMISVIEQALQ